MQEHNVTAAGTTYRLDEPFFVLATQNPIEQEGTYPLPEAQLDRFMFNLWLDYPSFDEEIRIVQTTTTGYMPEVKPVLGAQEISEFQDLIRRVPARQRGAVRREIGAGNPARKHSAVKMVKDFLSYGAGPWASQYLVLWRKNPRRAVRKIHPRYGRHPCGGTAPVLRHRIVTNFSAEADNIGATDIVAQLLREV